MEVALDAVGPVPRDMDYTYGTYADTEDLPGLENREQNGTGAEPEPPEPPENYEPLLRRPRLSLPIFEPPEFTKRLNSFVEAEAGATVVFECHYKALPKPKVRWFLDDKELVNGQDDHVHFNVVENKGILQLIIDGCRKGDEGAYKCKIENVEGSASSTGYLSVTGEEAEKSIAQQQKKKAPKAPKEGRSVSLPPHLRTIVEQKSLEEKEYEVTKALPPSPIQDFIDLAVTRRPGAWPKGLCPELIHRKKDKDDDSESTASDTSVESQAGSEPCLESVDDDLNDLDSQRSLEVTTNGRRSPTSPPTPSNKPYWAYPDHQDTADNVIHSSDKPPAKPARQSRDRSRRPKLKLMRSAALSDQDSSEEEALDDDVFIDEPEVPLSDNTIVLVPDSPAPNPPERADSLNNPVCFDLDTAAKPTESNGVNYDETSAADEEMEPDDAGRNSAGMNRADGAIVRTFTPEGDISLAAGIVSKSLDDEVGDGRHMSDILLVKTQAEIKESAAPSGAPGSEAEVPEREGGSPTEPTSQESPEMESEVLVSLVAETQPEPVTEQGTPGPEDVMTSSVGPVDLPGEITVTLEVDQSVAPEADSTQPAIPDAIPSNNTPPEDLPLEPDTAAAAEQPGVQTERNEEFLTSEADNKQLEISTEDLLTLNMAPVLRSPSPNRGKESENEAAEQEEADTAPQEERKQECNAEETKSEVALTSCMKKADEPNVKLRENRARLRRKRAGLSKVLSKSFETGTLPEIDWDAFFALLDSFWIYYVVLSVIAASAASATGVSPFYLIIIVALLSFIGFSLVSSLDETQAPDSSSEENDSITRSVSSEKDLSDNCKQLDQAETSTTALPEATEATHIEDSSDSVSPDNIHQDSSGHLQDSKPAVSPIEPTLD